MSVWLNPSDALVFRGPLTELSKCSLTITNDNAHPIAFRVMATAPKSFRVNPNLGRVGPDHSFEVSVRLQGVEEGPHPVIKSRDKFQIRSVLLITPEMEMMPLQDLWKMYDDNHNDKSTSVYQKKLRVRYLPPEAQPLPEENESRAVRIVENVNAHQHHLTTSTEPNQDGVLGESSQELSKQESRCSVTPHSEQSSVSGQVQIEDIKSHPLFRDLVARYNTIVIELDQLRNENASMESKFRNREPCFDTPSQSIVSDSHEITKHTSGLQEDLYEAPAEQFEKEYVEMGIQVEYYGKNLPLDLDYSFFSLLSKLRSKKPGDPISEAASVSNVDLFRKLLGMNDYINMASLVGEDAELLFEFILYLLEKNRLPNTDLCDANRRVRRLMFKIAARKPVIPKSMFITDVGMGHLVGWGGFANVFRGEFRGRHVAAKLLRTSRQSDICREALTWKSLSHKFVLPFLGIYEDQSQLYLVSPFMTNGNLSAWRKNLDCPTAEIQRLVCMALETQMEEYSSVRKMLEVAEGMQYIHSEGIVHGDLRGTNVLLDADCHVKIVDFGLTRHVEATITQTTMFSPHFAAPELFGHWGDDDDDSPDSEDDIDEMSRSPKSDVYAFGCLYYEIHFNIIPFDNLTYRQLVKQVAQKRKRPDRLPEPPLLDKAWKLIKRCWRHERSKRPSMEAVLESMMKWDIAKGRRRFS